MIPIVDAFYEGAHGITFYECTSDRNNPIGPYLAHTWKNLFMIPLAKPSFAAPSKKVYSTDMPGADGKVDSSSALTGYPLYNNREGEFSFCIVSYDYHTDEPVELLDSDENLILDSDNEPILVSADEEYDITQTWAEKYTQLMDMFHGRELIAILDDDPEYYYRGFYTASVQSASDGLVLTLSYDVEPYKTRIDPATKGIYYKYYQFFSPVPEAILFIPSRMPALLEFCLVPYEPYEPYENNITPRFSFENPETKRKTTIILDRNKTEEYYLYTSSSAVITNMSGRNVIRITPINDEEYLSKYHISMRFREGEL